MTNSSQLLVSWFLLKIQVFLRATNYSIYAVKVTATWMPIGGWMDGKQLCCVYTMGHYSRLYRGTLESFLNEGKIREPILQSEVSQEKATIVYCACTRSPERRCWWTPSSGSSGDADVEGRLVGPEDARRDVHDGAAWRREHHRGGGNPLWTQELRPGAPGQPGGVGWGRGREGTHVYPWPVHFDVVWDQHSVSKAITPQLKINKNLKSYFKKGKHFSTQEETGKENNKMHVFSKIRYEKNGSQLRAKSVMLSWRILKRDFCVAGSSTIL